MVTGRLYQIVYCDSSAMTGKPTSGMSQHYAITGDTNGAKRVGRDCGAQGPPRAAVAANDLDDDGRRLHGHTLPLRLGSRKGPAEGALHRRDRVHAHVRSWRHGMA